MSKLSLKVLLGVFALMFSASVGLSAAPECSGSPRTAGLFGMVSGVGWHKCNGEIFRKRSKRDYGFVPSNQVGERYRWSRKGLWMDGLLVQGTKVHDDGTYEGTWEYIDGNEIKGIFKGKVTYLDGTTFNGQIGKLSNKFGGSFDYFAFIGTLTRPDGTELTGEFEKEYTENHIDNFDELRLISSSVGNSVSANKSSRSSSKLPLLKAEFIKLSDEDRRFIQSRLADLKLYSSSIDSLYGRGTESALNAYNKEYLGDADLGKSANADALLKDILTPKVAEVEEVAKIEDTDLSLWYPNNLCMWAKEITPNDGTIWATNPKYKEYVAEAQRRGLSCGVGNDIPKQSAAVEQPEPESTPKLDIAQVQASYDAKDYTKAFTDAQVLAVQGNPEAQLLLGKMFADGRGTLQVSTVAHMWFNIASMGGIDEAYEQRKAITARMTPSAVEEAQKMAMSCIQSNYADCGLTVKPVAVKQPKPVEKKYITSGSQIEAWFKDETRLKRKQLHYALKNLGVYNSSVDGLWGPNTSRAFTRYINKYKRDAENVDEIFSSILSKVKVPSSFSTSKNTNSSKSSSNQSSKSGLTAIISNPSVAANQAMAICQPKAEIQAQNEYERRKTRGSGKITCKTTNDIMGWGSDTECKQSSGGGFPGLIPLLLEIDPASVAERAAKDRYKNALNSCLAEYGWKK